MATVALSAVGLMPRSTGIERYARAFAAAVVQSPPLDVTVVPVVRAWLASAMGLQRRDCIVVPDAIPAPIAVEGLPMLLRRVRPDLVHGLDLAVPRATILARSESSVASRWVQMVHDSMLWENDPSQLSNGARWYYGPSLRSAARSKRLSAIVTTTQASAAAIRPHIPVTLPVTALGAAGFPLPEVGASGRESIGSRAPVERNPDAFVVVSVGTVEPRKGLGVLASAVGGLRERGVAVTWWHVGRMGWGTLPGDCEYLGPISDAELNKVLRSADVFVSASLGEGFNMAAAEAITVGVACVLSDIPAHRENFGQSADLVPPGDSAALGEALLALSREPAGVASQAVDPGSPTGPSASQRGPAWSWAAVAARAGVVWEALI